MTKHSFGETGDLAWKVSRMGGQSTQEAQWLLDPLSDQGGDLSIGVLTVGGVLLVWGNF